MKRISLLLILLFIIAAFAACGKKTSVSDAADSDLQDSNIGVESDSTTEISSEETTIEDHGVKADSELINSLKDYLPKKGVVYRQQFSVEDKLDKIYGDYQFKEDIEPVLLEFSGDKFYVCAYYNADHENEDWEYCCSDQYEWIRFDNVNEIVENYYGKKLLISFQIDDASYVEKPLSDDTGFKFSHFQIYTPVFDSGLNIAGELSYNKSYIYLNTNTDNSSKHVYYTLSCYAYEDMYTVPCIKRNGEYYALLKLNCVNSSGQVLPHDIKNDFGKYYDFLNESIIGEKFSEVGSNGNITYYGMIITDDFLNAQVDDDRYISREDRVLDIEAIARNSIVNISHILNIKVENGDLYVNNLLYNKVSSIENVDIDFSNVVPTKDGNQYKKQLEVIIEQIQAQEYCYLIDTSEKVRMGYTLFAYYINGTCYFVTYKTDDFSGDLSLQEPSYVCQIFSSVIEDTDFSVDLPNVEYPAPEPEIQIAVPDIDIDG